MARTYEEKVSVEWHTAVPLEVLWSYIFDLDAQVRYDTRIRSISMTHGVWGQVGSVMALGMVADNGKLHVIDSELVAVDEPRSYTTRMALPDVVTVTTVTTEAFRGGTLVRFENDARTRPISWLQRTLLKATRTKRQVDAEANASAAQRAVEAYFANQ